MTGSKSPDEWYQEHWQELKEYVGEWIAYSKDGVISHDSPKEQLSRRFTSSNG